MPASVEGGKTTIYSFSAGNDAVYFYAEEGNPMGEFYTYMPQYTDDGKLIVGSEADSPCSPPTSRIQVRT